MSSVSAQLVCAMQRLHPMQKPISSFDSSTSSVSAPAAAAAPGADDGKERPATWQAVTAPMVGTYYEAPAPGEPPFVREGDEVAANETLCIVEAMKLMNEITADEMGTVREVCLEDASPVEYGTVLFYIEPHETVPTVPETE